MEDVKKVYDFLEKAGTFYLAFTRTLQVGTKGVTIFLLWHR